MEKARRHERFALTADVTIQPGEEHPSRFGAKVYNVSLGGLAVFSPRSFPPGKLASMEVVLPLEGEAPRRLTLFGVTRWTRAEPDGNLVGIELLADGKAGDYALFARHFALLPKTHMDRVHAPPSGAPDGGFTLIEVSVVMTIICLLVTLAIPTFRRAVEQARLDAAGANLRMVWSAQRLYWLENRCFSPALADLSGMDLIDPAIAGSPGNPKAVYVYQITQAGASAFEARALRNAGGIWIGQVLIDQDGTLSGSIACSDGQVLKPTQ